MESIDALAQAVNDFEGGLVLVSHDMRLISQVAKEIWICDHKSVKKYNGDIQNFKMDMRAQMGINGEQKGTLRGDASVKVKEGLEKKKEVKNIKKEGGVASVISAPSSVRKTQKDSKPSLSVTSKSSTSVKGASLSNSVPSFKPRTESASAAGDSGGDLWGSDDEESNVTSTTASTSSSFNTNSLQRNLPRTSPAPAPAKSVPATGGRYIPPHLRNRQ